MATVASTGVKLTKKELVEYLEIVEQRKALESAERTARKKVEAFFEQESDGDKSQGVEHLGYRLGYVEGRRYPRWKEAFVERLGEAAAFQVEQNTPVSLQFVIEKE